MNGLSTKDAGAEARLERATKRADAIIYIRSSISNRTDYLIGTWHVASSKTTILPSCLFVTSSNGSSLLPLASSTTSMPSPPHTPCTRACLPQATPPSSPSPAP